MASSSLPQNMRAMEFTTTTNGLQNNLHLNPSAPLPSKATSLPPNHTLVKVSYTTLNPVDYKIFESPARYFLPKPHITCMDFAGTVVRTERPDLRPGQRVFGKTEPPAFGALADFLVVGPNGCTAVPEALGLEEVAGVGVCGLTAYQCIAPFVEEEKGQGAAGKRVLIVGGSGGTGTFGIQIAKALGCHVVAVCSGANAELCRSIGADEVLDYKTLDVVEALKKWAKRKGEFDLIVDNVGANLGIYFASHEYLKPQGRYNLIGGEPTLSYALEFMRMFVLPAWLGGGQRKAGFVICNANVEGYNRIAGWMAEGKIRMVTDQSIELEDVGRGFERLKTGRTTGKIVVQVSAQ